jgi:putative PIN family toxin of toxin-antitoxin system
MKIVCDTNVLVSGILFSGHCREIIRLISEGRIDGFTSGPLLDEFEDVIGRPKFGLTAEQVAAIMDVVRETFSLAAPTEEITVIADDPDDDAVIEAAVAAGAHEIVSGDDHLLSLQSFRDIRIVTPAAFMAAWESDIAGG